MKNIVVMAKRLRKQEANRDDNVLYCLYFMCKYIAKYLYFTLINLLYDLQYVVLDCEFSDDGNEVIQIALCKLNSHMQLVDHLNLFIKPIKQNVIQSKRKSRIEILQQSNESTITFPQAINTINEWLDNDCKNVMCSWSYTDISMINKNCRLHNLSPNILKGCKYFNIQKVYTKKRVNKVDYRPELRKTLKKEKIQANQPMHNALVDASYTVDLLRKIYSKQAWVIAQFIEPRLLLSPKLGCVIKNKT